MTDSTLDNCPACGRPWPNETKDGRTKLWRARIRLYAKAAMDDPEFDSDPELPPDAPGTLLLKGLSEVAHELARTATEAHRQAPDGLGVDLLLHKLKGLRPTLSRRGGNAAWRVHYKILQRESDFTGDTCTQQWLARVDIQRETEK